MAPPSVTLYYCCYTKTGLNGCWLTGSGLRVEQAFLGKTTKNEHWSITCKQEFNLWKSRCFIDFKLTLTSLINIRVIKYFLWSQFKIKQLWDEHRSEVYKFGDLMINYTFLFCCLNKQLLMNAFILTKQPKGSRISRLWVKEKHSECWIYILYEDFIDVKWLVFQSLFSLQCLF